MGGGGSQIKNGNLLSRNHAKAFVAGFALLFSLCWASCKKSDVVQEVPEVQTLKNSEITPQLNKDGQLLLMKDYARALSFIISRKDVRELIYEEVSKKFDGNYNALHAYLAYQKLPDGVTFEQTLIAASEGTISVDRLRACKLLQIAVPVRFEDWDASAFVPNIAYIPSAAKDTEWETIPAFKLNGLATTLDGKTDPTVPTIGVTTNERRGPNDVNYNSPVYSKPDDVLGNRKGGPPTGLLRQDEQPEYIWRFRAELDRLESWLCGTPEIVYAAFGEDGTEIFKKRAIRQYSSRSDYQNSLCPGCWLETNTNTLDSWLWSVYGNKLKYVFWEEDGGIGTVTVNYSWTNTNAVTGLTTTATAEVKKSSETNDIGDINITRTARLDFFYDFVGVFSFNASNSD